MKSIILLLLVATLTSCGFHTSNNRIVHINADIIAPKNHPFAKLLTKSLESNDQKSSNAPLTIHFESERQIKNIGAYNKGIASGHYLILTIPVKVYQKNKLLLKTSLTNSIYVPDTGTTLANQLQQNSHYQYLRQRILRNFLIQLGTL